MGYKDNFKSLRGWEELIPPLAVLRRSSLHNISSYMSTDGYEDIHKQVSDPSAPNHKVLKQYWQEVLIDSPDECSMSLELESAHAGNRHDHFTTFRPELRWIVGSNMALFADPKLVSRLKQLGEKQQDLKDLGPKEREALQAYRKMPFESLVLMGLDNDVLTGKVSINKAIAQSDNFIFLEARGIPPHRSLHLSVPPSPSGHIYAHQLTEFCLSLVSDRSYDQTTFRISVRQSKGSTMTGTASLSEAATLYTGTLRNIQQDISGCK